jgi:polyhydroxybutyrate depolymerase
VARHYLVEQRLLRSVRKVQYYLPEGITAAAPVPLVVALHGGISSPKNIRRRSLLNELADREKLVAAYPQGNGLFGLLLHWNAGFCCGKAVDKGIDDVAFVMETIDQLAATVPVDLSRVYVLGFSNGAMLTYSLAAAHPERIAGIAAVSGALGRVTPEGDVDWQIAPPPGGMPTLVIELCASLVSGVEIKRRPGGQSHLRFRL